jgi:uncharacterized protein YecT (DUF1311 family)
MTGMIRVSSLLLISAIFLCWACGQAAAQHMNNPDMPCNRPSSTAEESACFASAADAANKDLNSYYARIRSILSLEERNDLVGAQRAWLKYRDLTCTSEYKLYEGGTGGPVTRLACLAAVTKERVATLRTTYNWRLEKWDR